MPTSATGISINSRARGFTLIEILVVVVIIAIMSVGAVLSLSTAGNDRGLQNESERLHGLMDYLREQAEIQTREFGVRAFEGGYEFVTLDVRSGKWLRVANDSALRLRKLPEGVTLAVRVEARKVVLPKASDPDSTKVEDLAPQAMLLSSGDLNAFEFFLMRAGTGKAMRVAASDSEDAIEETEMQAGAI